MKELYKRFRNYLKCHDLGLYVFFLYLMLFVMQLAFYQKHVSSFSISDKLTNWSFSFLMVGNILIAVRSLFSKKFYTETFYLAMGYCGVCALFGIGGYLFTKEILVLGIIILFAHLLVYFFMVATIAVIMYQDEVKEFFKLAVFDFEEDED